MNKKEAQKLVGLVSTKTNMDDLSYYSDYRVELLKDRLATTKTWEEVQRLQGAIEEILRLKNLREEVLNPRDN